uniref:Uncharacterized protein n=1 Tax=Rhodococcus sp. NS1 TaxID=402236 RepID=A0A097SQ54_9NOCA|nr:hypothetical protein LRS1606.225 [Rhodococcus sp. NS1]
MPGRCLQTRYAECRADCIGRTSGVDEIAAFVPDDIMLTRTLDSSQGPVVLEVNAPRPFVVADPAGDHYCTFRISAPAGVSYEVRRGCRCRAGAAAGTDQVP